MKKKKLFTMVLAVALVAIVGVGATLAYFTDKDEKTNVITMGKVDITLIEPEFDKNQDSTISGVKPNQEIKKDPLITVAEGSEDAYLRAKVTFKGLTDTQINEILPRIAIEEGWVLNPADQYYYYQTSKKATEQVYLFQTVTIPEKWGNEIAEVTFEINVVAEAIQADSFNPTKDARGNIIGWHDLKNVEIEAETQK